mmetsp:Transcript_35345/g.54109  ORF Transcript_35345/g.54109 Transcript_35345/m.54109 type:complete len:135 (+) Transcript_35345:648-1052(+)
MLKPKHGDSSQPKFMLMSKSQYSALLVKRRFLKVLRSQGGMMLCSMKPKYFSAIIEEEQKATTRELKANIQTMNDLLVDQFNLLKFAFLGNNFNPKTMLDVQKVATLAPLASLSGKLVQMIYSFPKFIKAIALT